MPTYEKSGGEAGIRTLGTGVSPYNGLANRRIRPLCHLSGARVFISLTQLLEWLLPRRSCIQPRARASYARGLFVFRNRINFVELDTRISEKLLGN